MPRVLFVTSEAHPLVKTGGLADVSGSLPPALEAAGAEVRLLLPGYRAVLDRVGETELKARVGLPGVSAPVEIRETPLPGTDVPVWLVICPELYDRPGGPYTDPATGSDWPDNALRFATLARAALAVCDGAVEGWKPEVVHCHDWQAGLVPALLAQRPARPATIFTIHNLAYRGLFSRTDFDRLGLPPSLWSLTALEFYGDFSFMKGGLVYSDWITTVSPNYAQEIRTPEFGWGMEGLLEARAARLVGILNGLDLEVWDPASDPLLPAHYDADHLAGKAANKAALQERFGLPRDASIPVAGFIGRLVDQKGVDLILDALPQLLDGPIQLVVLGSGDPALERRLLDAAETHPHAVGVVVGYDEALAHLIEAGADIFLMPSRFEPCGLNQMYSQRYGTIPVVHGAGGLVDTVVTTNRATVAAETATGFVFQPATAEALAVVMRWALLCHGQPRLWRQIMRAGMRKDFSWSKSAAQYMALYDRALAGAKSSDAPRDM